MQYLRQFGFLAFSTKNVVSKSHKINELRFDENLVFAPFHYLAKVLVCVPVCWIIRIETLEDPWDENLCDLTTPGSPIFKAVQKKRGKALCRALTKSPQPPESAVGEGAEPSEVDRSV